jgi:anaerobic selenocysteine-containing dehydrogenase
VVADFPDGDLARQALENIPFIVAGGAFVTEASRHADVMLPIALYGEKAGTATNLEGRVERLARKVTPAGTSMEDWRVAAELALRLDVDFDLESVSEVQAEIARLAPAYAQVTPQNVVFARDGVVVPEGREELRVGRPGHPVAPVADAEIGQIGGEEVQVVIQGRVVPPAHQHDALDTAEGSIGDAAGAQAAIGEEAVAEASPATGDDPDASGPLAGGPGADPAVPPLHEWDRAVAPVEIPHQDSYALRLVVGRKLYDEALMVQRSQFTAPLALPAVLHVSPAAYEGLGVSDDEKVKVTSTRGSIVLPVRADPGVPKGVAWLAYDQPGPAGADLIDADTTVTDVRVETLQ